MEKNAVDYSTNMGQSLPINGIVSVNLLIKIPGNITGPVLKKIYPDLVLRHFSSQTIIL